MLKNIYISSIELLKEKIEDIEKYPFNLPIIQYLDKINFHENVTFFTGENWSWKSTLLEAIALWYWFNPEWWSINFNFSTQNTHSILWDYLRLSKGFIKPKDSFFLRAESFYNVASYIDELEKEYEWILKSYGWKSLHEQSHWESFFSLFINRLYWNWIYIFDEPEASLSPQRQLAFLIRMDELVKQNSQFIIATHSPIILSYPKAKIIEISENGFQELKYNETSNYSLYKTFINNPEYMLKKLEIKESYDYNLNFL